MSRNDARPSAGRRQQEAIFMGRSALRAHHCPQCAKETRTDRLRAFPTCVGYRCRSCGWESAPVATLNAHGAMVRATAGGQPTGEPIMRMDQVAP